MIYRFALLFLILSGVTSAQNLKWPDVSNETRPWTRMWWMGSIGTRADITEAFGEYYNAGLGGLEITCIYGVKGQEEKFVNYLSPEWMDKFTHILNEGERLGLGIDLANASGWPFGGPWVNPSDACRNINLKTWALKTGERLEEKIMFTQQPLLRPVGVMPDMNTLIEPIGLNKDLQLFALDQVRFEKDLPPEIIMAYSDEGKIEVLTDNIGPDGSLNWTAPAGNWTIYALFEGWHGKMAERAGPGGEGDVIDHFSSTAIHNFLRKFDSSFSGYEISYLRGFFNDSYEVDDASGQANWTGNLFEEFRQRRGYDLRFHLPALFQNDEPEKNARVLSDYRLTISDLILENFTWPWTEWANKQGKITRNQAHGSPANILDLYAASDIPETEGNEITRFKFASSAASVTGKKLVSCEAATWLNEHFLSTPGDVREAADMFFLGGINHLFWHGTCFTPAGEPWPGFLFYASTEFTPANSWWSSFSTLNAYITRVQSFLQQGKPDNDILLYFPVFDSYANYGKGLLEHFDALSPNMKKSRFGELAELLPRLGYNYDYISDLQLMSSDFANGRIVTEGNEYSVIVIPGCSYMPVETFSRLAELANKGAIIIFYGDLPVNVSGFSHFEDKTLVFNQLKESFRFSEAGEHAEIALTGSGKIISGDNPGEMLSLAGVRREQMPEHGISFVRRKNGNSSIYFLKNESGKEFSGWMPLCAGDPSLGIFNPLTGEYGLATTIIRDEVAEIYLQIKPSETLIIQSYPAKAEGENFTFWQPASEPIELTGKWKLDFIDGGPLLPVSRRLEKLISWTETGGEDVKNFSGTGLYSIKFKPASVEHDALRIDLGTVCSSARVILNGIEVARLIGPDFEFVIKKELLKKRNELEIEVSNLMANRIAWMDRNNIEWKRFYNINIAARLKENNKNGVFDASHWQPLQSGLIGPVILTPVKRLNL